METLANFGRHFMNHRQSRLLNRRQFLVPAAAVGVAAAAPYVITSRRWAAPTAPQRATGSRWAASAWAAGAP